MMGTSSTQRLRLQLVAADFLERMGARMREQRELLGLSRAEVARRMPGKVNENQVYRWEKGLHQPNPDTLQALGLVLDCDVSFFMSPPPEQTITPELITIPVENSDRLEQIEATLELIVGVLEQQVGSDVLEAVRADIATARRSAS